MKPLIEQRADPYILLKDGWYYFTASVPAFDLIELRRAETIEGLAEAEPKVVWACHESGPLSKNIWAPEIHFIDGKWYIYFAAAQADADEAGCYDHRIYILENDSENPLEGSFVEKGQMDTGWESFALDATQTVFEGKRYFIWAQREHEIKGNSNLYIAEMESATKLKLPAVRLSIPEYDWECQGFLVNEGPGCLHHNGNLYVTYSASATDERYAVGLLTMKQGCDPLKADNWTKSPTPIMVSEPEHELFGPGHNSFTKDGQGNDILVFHARPYPGFRGTALSDPNRHCHIRKIRYAEDGSPILQAQSDPA